MILLLFKRHILQSNVSHLLLPRLIDFLLLQIIELLQSLMHLLRVQVTKVDWRVLVLHVKQLVLQSEGVIKRRDRLRSSLAWELLRVHLVQEVAELCAHVAFVPE